MRFNYSKFIPTCCFAVSALTSATYRHLNNEDLTQNNESNLFIKNQEIAKEKASIAIRRFMVIFNNYCR